jgi:hypothetical protein
LELIQKVKRGSACYASPVELQIDSIVVGSSERSVEIKRLVIDAVATSRTASDVQRLRLLYSLINTSRCGVTTTHLSNQMKVLGMKPHDQRSVMSDNRSIWHGARARRPPDDPVKMRGSTTSCEFR